jgi:hypothetical protein
MVKEWQIEQEREWAEWRARAAKAQGEPSSE